jgi:hypothetical protein
MRLMAATLLASATLSAGVLTGWVEPRLLGCRLQADSATSATLVRVEGGDSFTLGNEQVGLRD